MRAVLTIVLLIGVGLFGGAVFLAIDGYATDDRREAFQQSITDAAETHDQKTRRERRFDPIGRAARIYNDLSKGVFKSAGLDLPDLLPAAPEGWTRRDFALEDGTAITGALLERTPILTTTTNSILKDFDKAGRGGKLNARATYESGERLVALRMVADLKAIRRAEKGEISAKPAKGRIFARVSGVPVLQEPRFSINHIQNTRDPVTYRRFTIPLDGQAPKSNSSPMQHDADVLAILRGLDMVAIQDGSAGQIARLFRDGRSFSARKDPATEPPA